MLSVHHTMSCADTVPLLTPSHLMRHLIPGSTYMLSGGRSSVTAKTPSGPWTIGGKMASFLALSS